MSDACAMTSSRGNTRGETGPDKSRRHDTSSAISRRMELLESRLNPRIEGAMPDTLSMTALHPIADQCAPASLEAPGTGVHQSQTLRAVNLAADRHMQKLAMTSRGIPAPAPPSASSWHPGIVVGDSSQHLTNLNTSNTAGSFSREPGLTSFSSRSPPFTALPSPSVSASISGMSFSNQTLITSHTRQKHGVSSVTDRGVRVSETPPAGEASQDSDTRRGGGSNCSHNSAKHQLTIGQSIGSMEAVQSGKRKSVPAKRALASISVNTGKPSHDQANAQTSLSTGMEVPKKRGRPNAKKANRPDELDKTMGADDQANSDLRLGGPLSTSRDPIASLSNPSPTGGPQRSPTFLKKSPAPNNRLISQFFGSSKKKTENSREKASPTRSGDRSRQEQAAALSSSGHEISPTTRLEFDRLQEKCQQWEKICSDQEQQLKAVANNQSIMHHALRGVLTEREKDIDRLKEEMQQRAKESMKAIEHFVRTESARREKDLRQKLASDGARLGRIVYTRTGMHTVESWEDGHDAKLLKKRRSELRHQRLELEKRQKLAENAQRQISDGNGADGIDDLDVMEAEESVRRHLDILKEKERDLAEEEKALHVETGIHIRSLKLVASEDCSRFKSKEKLHDRYVPLSLLGKGGFSEVWKAYDLSELREVAVKIHQLDPRWSEAKKENYTKHVSREYEIHRDVRHPRIVSLYDVFEIDSNSFATVLECCSGNDLDSLLKEKLVLPERDARAVLLQILSGMRYLSMASPDGTRQGIIHYDLKPGNILFDENGDAKITDFGLSKIVDESDAGNSMELTSQGAGTYWYLPPECFMTHENVRISNKVDVWSIGVIYYQMVFGKRPFGDGQSQDKVLSHGVMLNAREVKFPPKPEVSEECKEFIRQCLMYDQTFRPTVSQLCQQPYLHQKSL